MGIFDMFNPFSWLQNMFNPPKMEEEPVEDTTTDDEDDIVEAE